MSGGNRCIFLADKPLHSFEVNTPGSDPIKKKINISKEIINKTRGAEAPYAAQIFTHLSVLISHLRGQAPLTKCEQKFE